MSDQRLRKLRRLSIQGDREAWDRLWTATLRTKSAELLYDALTVKPDNEATEVFQIVDPKDLFFGDEG